MLNSNNNYLIKVNGHMKTGGPLCMLQLGSKLQELGAHVTICLDDPEAIEVFGEWINQLFDKVDVIFLKDLNNYNEHNLIVTETDLRILKGIKWKGYVVCYMLSVDNCAAYGLKRLTIEGNIRHFKNIIRQIYKGTHEKWATQSKQINLFVAQSLYAMEVLQKTSSTPTFFIGDYTDNFKTTFQEKNNELDINQKLRVCYNPKKGRLYSPVARFFNKSIEFIPIQNLDASELVQLFKTCDAYVDFGSQPGKDRLPREAIACGCPAFILNSGAGLNYSDFPRSKEFRFKISQILSLSKVIKNGVILSNNNRLFNRCRIAEIFIEEQVFTFRVKQLLQILR